MNPERKPAFSPEELEEIGELAISFAQIGEEGIDELVLARNQMYLGLLQGAYQNLGKNGLLPAVGELLHDIDTVTQVITRARLILRLEGKGRMSKMLDDLSQAGISLPGNDDIWGSV